MGKKLISLAVICALCLALFGCAKKQADLSQQDEGYIRDLTTNGVYYEVYMKYGLEPGVTTDKITAYGERTSTGKLTFNTEGSYSVMAESGEIYTGTFKVTGHIMAHGMGTDSVEITAPKNGLDVLPEQSKAPAGPGQSGDSNQSVDPNQSGDPNQSDDTTQSAEPTETTLYQPLSDYISENIRSSAEKLVTPPLECDINGDGHAELCVTVTIGITQNRGIDAVLVAVYDVYNDCGYMLYDPDVYDYAIMGASEDVCAVSRRKHQESGEVYGVLAIQDGELVFIEEDEYKANLPSST